MRKQANYDIRFIFTSQKQRNVNNVQDAIKNEETEDQDNSETLNGTSNPSHFLQTWKLKYFWLIHDQGNGCNVCNVYAQTVNVPE